MRNLCLKYKSEILYLFFGGCTTLVNILCYFVLYRCSGVSNFWSTVAAWLASVLFAYATNRSLVFESRASGAKAVLKEMFGFFGCRFATGIMDTVLMVVTVDYMHGNSMFWKIISNVLVVVLNYIAGKWVIFRKKE